MLLGIPITLFGVVKTCQVLKDMKNDKMVTTGKNNEECNNLFKSMGLISNTEWVNFKGKKREKAYTLYRFELCDNVSYMRFKESEDFIAEKIGAKDKDESRLNIFFEKGEMCFKIAHADIPKLPYAPIKVDDLNKLLIGHDYDYEPVFSIDTNLLVCGITGSGKSTIINTLIINILDNEQGDLYLGDLKKTEFWGIRNKKGVVKVAEEMEEIEELIKSFTLEYERICKVLRNDMKQYRNVKEYNKDHVGEELKPYYLVIDEFADIALKYIKKDEPFGIYKDLISLAAKIRFTGGRIILGTQRPSVDIIKGVLKNNFNLVGMRTINEINSKIVLDEAGLEDLKNFQAKVRLDGKIIDVLSYYMDEEMIEEHVDQLLDK